MGVTLPNQGGDVCFGTSREAESLHLANRSRPRQEVVRRKKVTISIAKYRVSCANGFI
jgi:hypothetical protein